VTDLSVTQIRQVCAAVLGATAKVPEALIGVGMLLIMLSMLEIAGETLFILGVAI
jgi:hypothetical protein